MDYPIEVVDLVKDYGKARAVDHVSFNLGEGEIFGLLGPNGAGKTSIISTIVGLETPTSGEVRVFGNSVSNKKGASLIGWVPQELINHGYFNVLEILDFHSGYYGIRNNKVQIDYLLDKLGLTQHKFKRVKQLSGGMKRRLLIAKALVHTPKVLLLDEPTAGVDIELRASLWEFVEELKSKGVSILLTTHYLEEAEQLCDRVGIINHGRILRLGKTRELIKDLTLREVIIEFKGVHSEFKHAHLVSQSKSRLHFKVPSDMALGQLFGDLQLRTDEIVDIHIEEGSLEEAFKSVIGPNTNSTSLGLNDNDEVNV